MNTESSFNILFLGGGKRVSLAKHLKKAAREKGLHPAVYSYELSHALPIAEEATILIGKRWADPELLSDLKEMIRIHRIHMVLPFVDPAIEIAACLSKENIPGLYIPVSDLEICRTMFDKIQSDDWFRSLNIPRPLRYTDSSDIEFPAILKPRNGSASKGIHIVYSATEFESFHPEDYLMQKFITNSKEFTVDCFVDSNGAVTSIVPRERLEVAGGEVTVTKTVRDAVCVEWSRLILACGKFRGPITLQFIRDQNSGETFIMEVNPRLGGGVIASICAGSGILLDMVDEYLGNPVYSHEDWKENTLMTRYMKEVIFYADHH